MQKRIQIKMMTDSLALLRKAKEYIQNGESEKADKLFDTEITELKRKKEK